MAPIVKLGQYQKHALYPYMSEKGPFTIEVPGVSKVEGETIPRRNPGAKDGLAKTPDPERIQTLYDILKYSSEQFGNAKALAWRKTVKIHSETKKVKKTVDGETQEVDKKWSYFELSPYEYISYVEYEKLALDLGSGLASLGLDKESRLHVYATTGPNWLAMSHAAASQSVPIATAYDTLGEEGLRHSLKQTRAKAIYTEATLLKTLANVTKDTPDLKTVIYNDLNTVNDADIQKFSSANSGLKIISVSDLRKLGQQEPAEPKPPKPDDLCCIMYTSGSTGTPKGVPIKHRGVIAAVAGVSTIVGEYLGPGDRLLSYLPLAHIFEYVVENAFLYWGITMGYGNPKTLSDTSVRNCKGDIREWKPTVLVGVPAIWEVIKKGIIAKVDAGSPVVRNLFWGALSAKNFLMSNGLPGSGILDALVFKKVKEATGGSLKLCLNGGGPIPKETHRFISMAICPMIHGYGLTETCAMGALTVPTHFTSLSLGDIPSCIEIKLVDFPDAGYYSTNKPLAQGEVWIRGDSVLEQYYENEKETKEAITSDGWFKTGDIGEFDENGHLRVIDRKKNLVKTMNGEYIALEKLESIYRTAKVVSNICVYASPEHSKPIAIIVPAEPALKKLAQSVGASGDSTGEFVNDKKVISAVLKEMQAAGKQGGLGGIEIIDGVVIAEEEWTAENGYLTAAQKLVRKKILEDYKKEVDAAYKRAG